MIDGFFNAVLAEDTVIGPRFTPTECCII